ncbi:MAG: serine dehydratase beta chain, partial [Pseudomonadota bacterium]|nr:serine dehydratase beta chain [Pseudomonadota bacterium]
MLSILDIFRIGIGPSSSHTVGPMRIARRFVRALEKAGELPQVTRVAVELQGSLALTGIGHGTVDATILGLAGFRPERTDPDEAARTLASIREDKRLRLGDQREIAFDPQADIDLAGQIIPDLHPNGMVLRAYDAGGKLLREGTYFSTGGG